MDFYLFMIRPVDVQQYAIQAMTDRQNGNYESFRKKTVDIAWKILSPEFTEEYIVYFGKAALNLPSKLQSVYGNDIDFDPNSLRSQIMLVLHLPAEFCRAILLDQLDDKQLPYELARLERTMSIMIDLERVIDETWRK
jgi:hypothetical protein